MHPLIRLRLKITAAERGAAEARKRGREDIADKFERAATLYRTSVRMGLAAMRREVHHPQLDADRGPEPRDPIR
jgi:hypothetical protein